MFDGINIGLVAVAGAFLIPIMGILCGVVTTWIVNWRKVRVSEHLSALKQSMIERGMSADEIERIINAGQPSKERPAEVTCAASP
jgi:hypothetical protein